MSLVLIGGGARSGKSAFAVRRALEIGTRRVFVATAEAFDDEMHARIAAHAVERGDAFSTVEAPRELEAALERITDADVVVVDCLTLWLSNLLLAEIAPTEIERRCARLADIAQSRTFPVLLVTNEVGCGLVPETPLGRTFRDLAGRAHQTLSRSATEVHLAALGCILRIKPAPIALEAP